jgi:acetyl-CoA carboxylase carboxyl transferase subunit beta
MSWLTRIKAPKPEGALPSQNRMPDDTWSKCPQCAAILFTKELRENVGVCLKCNYHFRLSSQDRIDHLVDDGSFQEMQVSLRPGDPLGFRDTKRYRDHLKNAERKTKATEAVRVGGALLMSRPLMLGVFDFGFMGGSMGSVVGEKLARMIEQGIEEKAPVVIVSASGGARMQEGILSLMQMAKVSVAISRLGRASIPYISLLTDPTTGGVAASFAMQGDVIIAEPQALIGFAGPRVIQQTIRQQLPAGFQRSEFLLAHGMIDRIVSRENLRQELSTILTNFGF